MIPSTIVTPLARIRLRSVCRRDFIDPESFVMRELGFDCGVSSVIEGPCMVIAVVECFDGEGDDLFVLSGMMTGWISETNVEHI